MLNLLKNRRSIRKFKDQEVPKDLVHKILEGALLSPSGKNIQPWELVVVDDKGKISKLGELRGPASKPISNSPLAIAVLADPDATDVWIEDSSIISLVIQLAAQSLNLSSCWIQVRNRLGVDDRDVEISVREILDIPDKYKVESIIAIGYPGEEKSPHDLEKIKLEKVKYNSFKKTF